METSNPPGDAGSIPIPPPTAGSAPKLSLRSVYTVLTLIFGILLGAGGLFAYQEYVAVPEPATYEACIKARGSVIQESYPATCVTRDKKRFTQPITNPGGINPIYTDPRSCNTNNDCVTGIQPTAGCCVCAKAVNKSAIGTDGWEVYKSGTDYSSCESLTACSPCETPTTPVCRSNQCVFTTEKTTTPSPRSAFTCPETEWVDCMPGPAEGRKLECTSDFLSWAKANCPNFQGAAY
ncbi:hypothetical protein HZB58_04065 [Candidatus Gottesmanbacteria bacterium]|nr:hypothetical protein [Candidatus Gottesmanbacteria bacterium]